MRPPAEWVEYEVMTWCYQHHCYEPKEKQPMLILPKGDEMVLTTRLIVTAPPEATS